MRDRTNHLRHLVLLLATVLVMLLASAATAFAGSGPVPASLAPSAPRVLSRGGVPSVLPAATSVYDYELPLGTKLFGYIGPGIFRVYHVPLRAGQTVTLDVYGGKGTDFSLFLFKNDDPYPTEPLAQVDQPGYPQHIAYDIRPGQSHWYDIVVFSYMGSGTFRLEYDLDESNMTEGPTGRIAGANRVDTSIQVARSAFTTAGTVVLSTGWEFADALAASGLCGSYGAPLLLTSPTSLSPGVLDEITSLDATEVIIVGSKLAVSDGVKKTLEDAGLAVRRIGGSSRFDTARLIALEIRAHEASEGRPAPTEAFLVSGSGYADALACSPYAFSQRMPVLLTQPHSLPSPTAWALAPANLGIDRAYVIGGPLAIDDGVLAQVDFWTPAAPVRIAGPAGTGRYATCAAVANYATTTKSWASWDYVGLATGVNYPDALGGGIAAGRHGGVILLANPSSLWFHALGQTRDTWDALYGHHAQIRSLNLYGSRLALSGCALRDADIAYFGNAGAGVAYENGLDY